MKKINIIFLISSILLFGCSNLNQINVKKEKIEESINIKNYSDINFYLDFKNNDEIDIYNEKINKKFNDICKNKDSNNIFIFLSDINKYKELLINDSISNLVLNIFNQEFQLKKKNTITLLNNDVVFLNKELDLTRNQEIFDKLIKNIVFKRERGINKSQFKIMHVDENKLHNKDEINYKLIQFYDKESKVMEIEYKKSGIKVSIWLKKRITLNNIVIKENSMFESLFFASDMTPFINRQCIKLFKN